MYLKKEQPWSRAFNEVQKSENKKEADSEASINSE